MAESEAASFPSVLQLSSLVSYQQGAVVSRTLVKQAGGTVTAFAFDAGEGLSEHAAPFEALVLGVEGEAEITVSGVSHRLVAGQLIQIPAGQPHALRAFTPFKMLLVMIKS